MTKVLKLMLCQGNSGAVAAASVAASDATNAKAIIVQAKAAAVAPELAALTHHQFKHICQKVAYSL